MFAHAPVAVLVLVFVGAAAAVWVAGIYLSNAVDVLATALGLGEALGGVILLAIVTNLPEIAIVGSAALQHNIGIALGNILGGIAIQTVVLVVLDVFGCKRSSSLTYQAASLDLLLEGVLVVGLLSLVIMGTQMPQHFVGFGITPPGTLIAIVWLAGIFLVSKARSGLPWHMAGDAPGGQMQPRGHSMQHKHSNEMKKVGHTGRSWLIFVAGSIVTLLGGILLEMSGDALSVHVGVDGVLFGATFLAAATALPEVSTGLNSIRLGDYKLAVSDILGGNAFLPVLILVATLLSGQSVLPAAHDTDIYLTGLGMLLTVVYLCGLVFRPRKQVLNMGLDSLVVLVLYIAGLAGLFVIVKG
jgi:cation:H+ antiporter